MAAELPEFLSSLVGVAQRGRSLGIHLILATQRPAGVVSDEIRANTNLRIALRLQDRSDATDIVGDAQPSLFARGTPGRAMMRLGPGETLVFQTAHSSGLASAGRRRRTPRAAPRPARRPSRGDGPSPPWQEPGRIGDTVEAGPTELVVLTRSIRGAASLCEVAPPFRPWLEPLGESIGRPRPAPRRRRAGGCRRRRARRRPGRPAQVRAHVAARRMATWRSSARSGRARRRRSRPSSSQLRPMRTST